MQNQTSTNIQAVRGDVLHWMESVRWPDEGWGRWKHNAALMQTAQMDDLHFELQIKTRAAR